MTHEELIKKLEYMPRPIVGIDEVGRGCLAGPVCAAAVIFCPKHTRYSYQDSKALNSKERAVLSVDIHKKHQVGIGLANEREIDQMNILQASLLAMKRAVLQLDLQKGTLLIDGKWMIPNWNVFSQIPVIKGDQTVSVIAAASIVAKHFRDQHLIQLSKKYLGYGLEKHKGYPTAFHRKMIQHLGPSNIHRMSFSGVKEYDDDSLN